MDFITYSVSKKLAEAAVSGVDSISAEGSNVIFKCKNGEDITVDIPAPEGVTVTNAYLENSHLFLEFSNGDKYDTGEISLNDHTHTLSDLNLVFKPAYDNPVSRTTRPPNTNYVPGQPTGILQTDSLQVILDKKVSVSDIYSNTDFPDDLLLDIPMMGGTMYDKAVPSLEFLHGLLKTDLAPLSSYEVEVNLIPKEDIDIGLPIPDSFYIIVEDSKINSLEGSEINVSKARLYEPSAKVGDAIELITVMNGELVTGGGKRYDKFISKTAINNNAMNFNFSPTDGTIYSAKVIWDEIKILRNCIEELYKKLEN